MTSKPGPATKIQSRAPTGKDTIVVLGAARGGTSMVAGLLRLLGLPMGEDINPDNNEDRAFLSHGGDQDVFVDPDRRAERQAFLDAARETIKQRNRAYDCWGWKDPTAAYYIEALNGGLRNPRYILITRDPGATLGRRSSDRAIAGLGSGGESQGELALAELDNVLDLYADIGRFFRKQARAALIVSYERSLRDPASLIDALCQFTGLEKPDDQSALDALIDYVQPERNTGDISYKSVQQGDHKEGGAPHPAEGRVTSDNGRYALIRHTHRQRGLTLAGPAPHDPVVLAEAMNAAAGRAETNDACALATLLLDALAVEAPSLELHPRLLTLEVLSADLPAPPLFASAGLFVLAMADLMDERPMLAYWRFSALRALTDRHGRWAAPAWASLYHLGLSAAQLGHMSEARAAFARVIHAPLAGFPADREAMERERDDLERFGERARQAMSDLGLQA